VCVCGVCGCEDCFLTRNVISSRWKPATRVQEVHVSLQRLIFINVIHLCLLFIITLLAAPNILQMALSFIMINVLHIYEGLCLACEDLIPNVPNVCIW